MQLVEKIDEDVKHSVAVQAGVFIFPSWTTISLTVPPTSPNGPIALRS
jgi:hypothetical protein